MPFNIVCNSKSTSHSAAVGNKPLKTEYTRTKKRFSHENEKLFLLIQAAVFLCLFNDSVNGQRVSRITQRWTHITTLRPPVMNRPGLRQGQVMNLADMTGKPADDQGQAAALQRFSTIKRKSTSRKRTTMWFESAIDQCDYLALTCLRAYQTGKVCARTVYYYYYTFKNYCMLDLVNCKLRYEYYQAIHMGDCIQLRLRSSEVRMTQESSHLMDGIYMFEQDFGL